MIELFGLFFKNRLNYLFIKKKYYLVRMKKIGKICKNKYYPIKRVKK